MKNDVTVCVGKRIFLKEPSTSQCPHVPFDPVFDQLLDFLSIEFDVPYAFITLSDSDWRWAAAQPGLSLRSILHENAVTDQKTSGSPLSMIHGLHTFREFSKHPLIQDVAELRFSVALPLVLKTGRTVGMICMCDVRQHYFDALDEGIFCALRDLVVFELTQRHLA